MKASQSRKNAIANNHKTYEGRPCKQCSSIIKYVCGHSCVNCMKIRVRSNEKKEYDKKYHIAHAEKKKQTTKNWIKANPEKRFAISFNYDSKRRANKKDGVKSKELTSWISKQIKVCYWCNVVCSDNYHIDHYEPLSKGGKHILSNLVISCPACNLNKNAKDPYKFALTKGRLF